MKENKQRRKKLEQLIKRAETQSEAVIEKKPSITSMRKMMRGKGMRGVMKEMLVVSGMSDLQQQFVLRAIIDQMPKDQVMVELFGRRDVGDAQYAALMQDAHVKDFMKHIEQLYLKITPYAAMIEASIMMDPKADNADRLKAAKQIKETAGVGPKDEKGKGQLPVKLNIIMNQLPPEEPLPGEVVEGGADGEN